MSNIKTLLCIAIAASLAACGGSEPDSEGVELAERAVTPGEAGTLRLVSRAPLVYSGTGTPWTKELLTKPTFEGFDAEKAKEPLWTFLGWHLGPPEAAGSVSVVSPEEAGTVSPVIALAQAASGIYVQQATHEMGAMPAGTWLFATARCKSGTPNLVGIGLGLKTSFGEFVLGEGHPGDGEWHDVFVAAPVPVDAGTQSFTLQLVRKPGEGNPVLVEHASLRFSNSPPANLPPKIPGEFVENGDFENYAFLGLPYPWRMQRWNSLGGQVIGGDAVVAAAETGASGKFAVHFVRANENSAVGISQQLTGLTDADRGKTLVARVNARAGHKSDFWIHLHCMDGKKEIPGHSALANHPGDGAWHEVRTSVKVPSDKLPTSVVVGLIRRSYSDDPVIADGVSVIRGQ